MKAYLPAVVLAVFSLGAGTLPGGATFGGAALAVATIWCLLPLSLPVWRDPLDLGKRGRIVVPILYVLVISSWILSPVGRAGLVAVTLLPAWLLLPAAIADCWSSSRARRQGALSIAVVVAAVAVWSLVDRLALGSARAAMPIGHHTALAVWLVLVWPLVWTARPVPRRRRWPEWSATGLALAALVATGSLAGLIVALVQVGALWALSGDRRARRGSIWRWTAGLGGAVAVLLIAQGGRLQSIVRGVDTSARARWVYLEGGLRGWMERPWLGWGPGSVPWTVSEFLHPQPGLNPPGEVVGDLHSLPVQLAYEIGVLGLMAGVVIVGLFLWRHRLLWRRSGLVALAGGALMAVTHAGMVITALPMAAVVAAGSVLAAAPRVRMEPTDPSPWPSRLLWLYRLGMLLILLPPLAAQFHYDRAVEANDGGRALAELDRAVALDPGFPLYRGRRAWLPVPPQAASESAAQALVAARQGRGLSVLWLAAGERGLATGESWAPRALARACRLDPLAAMAPYLLATSPIGTESASRAAVRSVLAEPLLAASPVWSRRPELLQATLEDLRRWPAVAAGWKQSMATTWQAARAGDETGARRSPSTFREFRELALEVDSRAAVAWSLHAFRRRPWPARLVVVELSSAGLEEIRIAAAASLPTTGRAAFETGCREADVAVPGAGEWP